MMKYPTLDKISCSGKTVFVRVDFNVSLNDKGEIRDDTRIRGALPTINELFGKGAKIVLASHLGRPKGKFENRYSLLPVAQRLAELLQCEVTMPDDCVGMAVKKLIGEMREKQVVLLENLRFHSEEENNDDGFSQKLAEVADIYVDDAFGAMHRAHASTVGMVKRFKEKAMGRLVEKEVGFLSQLLHEPKKPYVVILGGAKVSDKMGVIENLVNVANKIIIGGGMAYTFLKAQGYDVGQSLVEDTKLAQAAKLLDRAKIKGVDILLPVDSVIAERFDKAAPCRVAKNDENWNGWMGLDIGPASIEMFSQVIAQAKTIFWNGPMGVYEMLPFQAGTQAIAKVLAVSKAMTVVGGGDSLSAINQSGYAQKITHLSTGGGASLEFLEGVELPGLKALL